MKGNREYANFDRIMRQLMMVPHDEIKAKLDAEKSGKNKAKRTRRRPTKKQAGKQ